MKPIITSLFDTDYYKLLELFYKFYYHPTARVKYSSINRTKSVRIAEIVPVEALDEQLAAARNVCFTESEIALLQGTRDFNADIRNFIQYLANYRLPEYEIRIIDGQFEVTFEDEDSILSEIVVLSVMNQLLNEYRIKKLELSVADVFREAEKTLLAKIPDLKKLPKGSVLEFGSRRRFGKDWQKRTLEILLNEVSDVVTATSNLALAREFAIPWAGTHPHAGVMLEQGLAIPFGDKAIRESHNKFFTNWWALFPYPFRVALTDTYGDAFWSDISEENLKLARGFRWDSGSWEVYNNKVLKMLNMWWLDPKDYDAFYSDGLDPQMMNEIQSKSGGLFRNCYYGWGTNATNDMGKYKAVGLSPVSLVMKITAVNGIEVAKLSANPEKATGNAKAISRLKKIFSYQSEDYEAVVPTY